MKEMLNELGIEFPLLVAGFIGSLSGVSGIAKPLITKIGTVFLGVAAAILVTPLCCEVFDITNEKSKLGIAVIIGYLGIQGIQKLITSKLNINGNESDSVD